MLSPLWQHDKIALRQSARVARQTAVPLLPTSTAPSGPCGAPLRQRRPYNSLFRWLQSKLYLNTGLAISRPNPPHPRPELTFDGSVRISPGVVSRIRVERASLPLAKSVFVASEHFFSSYRRLCDRVSSSIPYSVCFPGGKFKVRQPSN